MQNNLSFTICELMNVMQEELKYKNFQMAHIEGVIGGILKHFCGHCY